MKRFFLPMTAFAVVVFAVGCPPETPQGGCTSNDDCAGGQVCSAGNCVELTDEGEGDEGEGEGEEGEGEGDAGEGEGEAPPDPVFRLEADVTGRGTLRRSGRFTLTGHTVLSTTTQVLQGERFTLRGAGVVRGAP